MLWTHPHLPRIWLLLTLTPAWLKSVVYLDESIREASDWDGPGQAGVAQVGVTPLLQLSLTSGQNLREWDGHNHNPQPTAKQQLACVKSHVLSCSVVSPSSHSASFLPGRSNSDVRGGNGNSYYCQRLPTVSCISHWPAHKRSAAIDPIVFLINGLSLWETTGFSSPIRALWWIYNHTAGLWLHQCLFLLPPPKLYKRGHKKTVPVLDNNFLHFLFFHSAENKDACISYEIFAQRFKVLTVIAVDLHFDDSFGLPCGVGFDEYVSIRCGTSASYALNG